jgi:protein phosphatase-4 regulatory subunit 3
VTDTQSVFARKEGPLADNFMTYFYEDNARLLFQPLLDIPTDESKLLVVQQL